MNQKIYIVFLQLSFFEKQISEDLENYRTKKIVTSVHNNYEEAQKEANLIINQLSREYTLNPLVKGETIKNPFYGNEEYLYKRSTMTFSLHKKNNNKISQCSLYIKSYLKIDKYQFINQCFQKQEEYLFANL